MAIAHEWEKISKELDTFSVYKRARPTLIAMKKLVDMIKDDSAFADVHPGLVHAALVLSRGPTARSVYAGWTDSEYIVAFVDQSMEFSERTLVGEDGVVRVLRDFLDRLQQ